jgi:hypothetical protein
MKGANMAIERGKLVMHKNLVIRCLMDHPEDLPQITSSWKGTAQELIDYLRDDPREWIVNGELSEENPNA